MKPDCKCTREMDIVEMKKLIHEAYGFIYRIVPEFPGQREWKNEWLSLADKYRKK